MAAGGERRRGLFAFYYIYYRNNAAKRHRYAALTGDQGGGWTKKLWLKRVDNHNILGVQKTSKDFFRKCEQSLNFMGKTLAFYGINCIILCRILYSHTIPMGGW